MGIVSLSSSKIFILVDDEDPVADAVSPVVTILEMYPDTAATTSMIVVMMQPKRARWLGGVL
jgi:hypothetical protein